MGVATFTWQWELGVDTSHDTIMQAQHCPPLSAEPPGRPPEKMKLSERCNSAAERHHFYRYDLAARNSHSFSAFHL